MAHDPRLDAFLDDVLTGRLSRRAVFRRGAALGLGATALLALAAARPSPASAQGSGKINVSSFFSDEKPRARFENLMKAFTEKSGIAVDLNTVEHEAFKQAIRTYLASDEPPDVLTWFAGNRMRFFVDKGLVMPVDDLFAQEGWTEAYPEGILSVSKGSDGKFYFVPFGYYHWAIFYRPSMFQAAGIEAPPATWDELLTVVDTFKQTGIVPFTIGTNQPWTTAAWFDYLNMRINGPEFHIQVTDGKVPYNSPEVKEVFARWRELLDKEAFIPNPEALKWQDAVKPLYDGEAAMYLMGRFIFDSYPEDGRADLDFFQFPTITPDVPVGEDAPTDGFFAAAEAANVEEAMQLLAFLGSAEAQQMDVAAGGSPAVHKDVPLDLYDPLTRKGLEMLQAANFIAQFYDRDTHPDMAERGMSAFVEFWNNPDDVDGILDRLDEERKRVFAAEQ